MYGEAEWWFDSLLELADSGSHEVPIRRADDEVVTPLQRVIALRSAGAVVGNQGDSARARALLVEAAQLMAKLDCGSRLHAQALAMRGISEWIEGDLQFATAYLCGAHDKAVTHFRKAVEIVRAGHIRSYPLGHCLEWQAALECALGRPADAAVLFGGAEAVWRASGAVRWAPWQASYEREIAELQSLLSSETRDAAWRKGTRCTAEEAIDYALALNTGTRYWRRACGHGGRPQIAGTDSRGR